MPSLLLPKCQWTFGEDCCPHPHCGSSGASSISNDLNDTTSQLLSCHFTHMDLKGTDEENGTTQCLYISWSPPWVRHRVTRVFPWGQLAKVLATVVHMALFVISSLCECQSSEKPINTQMDVSTSLWNLLKLVAFWCTWIGYGHPHEHTKMTCCPCCGVSLQAQLLWKEITQKALRILV